MKKTLLLLVLLLACSIFSTEVMASNVHGSIRSAVETGNRHNTDGTDYDFTKLILADGFLKSDDWGNFQLGYVVHKNYNQGDDNNGETEIEFRPGYQKTIDWGTYGGQLIFVQGRSAGDSSGYDIVKPEVNLTYNLTDKSRIYTRGLYEHRNNTGSNSANDWVEGEVQYQSDIGGGTIGTGLFIGDGVEKKDDDEVRGLLNYHKYFSSTKVFANFYSELRYHRNQDNGKKWKSYKVGVYANRPIGKGFVLEAETNVYHDFDETWDVEQSYRELFFMTGIKYEF